MDPQLGVLIAELREILDGIDRDDSEPGGWWETTVGQEHGSRALAALEVAVIRAWSERKVAE